MGPACGLIPAHAGKTRVWRGGPGGGRAHPRSRGENSGLAASRATWNGSSPLTRGKPRLVGADLPHGRLIPAHAGKTPRPDPRGALAWAHPRSRGENHGVQSRIVNQTGSSPLTRGKRHALRPRIRDRGLIPAHAGKTRRTPQPRTRPGAHPRSRGENFRSVMREARAAGSSPLTRGKPVRAETRRAPTGLIPAHAGKTCDLGADRLRAGAHPRSRGENGGCQVLSGFVLGSSPLTRGKRPTRRC